ncbi:hypothetical protein VTO73DRAFT_9987 [Trametes versicolor]
MSSEDPLPPPARARNLAPSSFFICRFAVLAIDYYTNTERSLDSKTRLTTRHEGGRRVIRDALSIATL